MLNGKELGQAIATAIKRKGVRKVDVASHFEVKPPSIQDWIKRGTISKDKLQDLWDYFSDVMTPADWGLTAIPGRTSQDRTDRTSTEKKDQPRTEFGWPFTAPREDFEKLRPVDRRALDKTLTDIITGALTRYQTEEKTGKKPVASRSDNTFSAPNMDLLRKPAEATESLAQGSEPHGTARKPESGNKPG